MTHPDKWIAIRAGEPKHLIAGTGEPASVLITECGLSLSVLCGQHPEHQRDSRQCKNCRRIAKGRAKIL